MPVPGPAGRPPAGPPGGPPIGLQLAQVAKTVSRVFDDALVAAGGSLPAWLILIALKSRRPANQRELAEAVGIQEATLTHHLNAMDASGLITRARDPANRRVQRVQLTAAGEAAFRRLRAAAAGFDQQLRTGFTDDELARLAGLLDRLRVNAGDFAAARTSGQGAGSGGEVAHPGEDRGAPPAR